MAIPKGFDVWRGQVRMPEPIIFWIKERAEKNFRSTNAEIVELLKDVMQKETGNAAH